MVHALTTILLCLAVLLMWLVTMAALCVIIKLLNVIFRVVRPRRSATLTFRHVSDEPRTFLTPDDWRKDMDVVVGKQLQAIFKEWSQPNGAGDELAPQGNVVYSTSDAAVATVDGNGLITAVGLGTATITATDSGNNLSANNTARAIEVAVSATLDLVAVNPVSARR